MIPYTGYYSASKEMYFLLRHGMSKPSSTTVKFKTVFNGSRKLNLESLWIAYSTRAQTFYLICLICRAQGDHIHTFLWRRSNRCAVKSTSTTEINVTKRFSGASHPVILYKFTLTTVTYGLVCSPYQATRTLRQLAADFQTRCFLAALYHQ